MRNSYTKRKNNMHNCAYAIGVFTSYHHPKCLQHHIVANVFGLRRTWLEIAKLGFNVSFDDMTIIEVTIFFAHGSHLH
jgi:hypothetical protein